LAVFPDASDLSTSLMQKNCARIQPIRDRICFFPRPARKVRQNYASSPRQGNGFCRPPHRGRRLYLIGRKKSSARSCPFVVEENVGAISISVESGAAAKIWLKTPALREGAFVDKSIAAALLGLNVSQLLDKPPQLLDAGNPTLFIPIANRATVDAIAFDTTAWKQFKLHNPAPLCVFAFTPTPEGAYSRMFAPDYGIAEDPASGSSTGTLGGVHDEASPVSFKSRYAFLQRAGNTDGTPQHSACAHSR